MLHARRNTACPQAVSRMEAQGWVGRNECHASCAVARTARPENHSHVVTLGGACTGGTPLKLRGGQHGDHRPAEGNGQRRLCGVHGLDFRQCSPGDLLLVQKLDFFFVRQVLWKARRKEVRKNPKLISNMMVGTKANSRACQ